MWQRSRGKYHLLLNFSADVYDGRFLQSACGDQIQVNKKNQQAFIWSYEKTCKVCTGVWHICFTSVADAKPTIAKETNMKVLRRALELAKQSTLRKAIEVRIKKLEKVGA